MNFFLFYTGGCIAYFFQEVSVIKRGGFFQEIVIDKTDIIFSMMIVLVRALLWPYFATKDLL